MSLFGSTKNSWVNVLKRTLLRNSWKLGTTYSFLMGTVLDMIWSLKMLKGGSGVCKSRLPG